MYRCMTVLVIKDWVNVVTVYSAVQLWLIKDSIDELDITICTIVILLQTFRRFLPLFPDNNIH